MYCTEQKKLKKVEKIKTDRPMLGSIGKQSGESVVSPEIRGVSPDVVPIEM